MSGWSEQTTRYNWCLSQLHVVELTGTAERWQVPLNPSEQRVLWGEKKEVEPREYDVYNNVHV